MGNGKLWKLYYIVSYYSYLIFTPIIDRMKIACITYIHKHTPTHTQSHTHTYRHYHTLTHTGTPTHTHVRTHYYTKVCGMHKFTHRLIHLSREYFFLHIVAVLPMYKDN